MAQSPLSTRTLLSIGFWLALAPMAATQARVAHPALQAHVDALNADFVSGWICAPTPRGADVPIYLDDTLLGAASLVPAPPGTAARCVHGTTFEFDFAFPSRVKDGAIHRVAVYARGPARQVLAQEGEMSLRFAPRTFEPLAVQPALDSPADAAAAMSGEGYRPPQAHYALFSVAPYCLPPGARTLQTPGALRYYTGIDGGNETGWSDAGWLVQGIQLAHDAAGVLIDNGDRSGGAADCAGLAGANALFAWSLDGPDSAPAIWAQGDKSRELVVAFDLSVRVASDTAYAGASLLLRTLQGSSRGDRYMFFDIQAFDTRASQPAQQVDATCTPGDCAGAMFGTAFGARSDTEFGRTVAGDFRHAPGFDWTHYEFRLSGKQLERALRRVGCSDRDLALLPCDAAQMRFSIAAFGMENVAPARLGASVRGLTVGYTRDAQ